MLKSRTRNRHDKDTPKGGSVYSEQGGAPPGFDIGRRMSRCPGKQKITTHLPPSLCDVTQTLHPPDPAFEHGVCALRYFCHLGLYFLVRVRVQGWVQHLLDVKVAKLCRLALGVLIAGYGDGPKHRNYVTYKTKSVTEDTRNALFVPSRFPPVRHCQYPSDRGLWKRNSNTGLKRCFGSQ